MKQDDQFQHLEEREDRNRRCGKGAELVRQPMSIKGCSEEIYGGREKVLRNRRTIEDFTVDTACGREGLNEDDTDLSVDTDYFIVRTDDGDNSRKSVQRNSSDTCGSANEMSTESGEDNSMERVYHTGSRPYTSVITGTKLLKNIEIGDSQSCEKNVCGATDLF